MERQKSVKAGKSSIAIFIIVLFHIVGLTGFFIPALRPLFIQIVPFHLLLMLAVIVYCHRSINLNFLIFALILLIAGFLVEWFGVHSHLLFGHYVYGQTLGTRLKDIPLMIGVNWFLLIYATGVLMQHSRLRNPLLKMVIGACILVLLDLAIEPVAVRFDYWHWLGPNAPLTAPFKNYADWFLVSLVMLGIFEIFRFKKQSAVAAVLMVTQFVFFILMRWA